MRTTSWQRATHPIAIVKATGMQGVSGQHLQVIHIKTVVMRTHDVALVMRYVHAQCWRSAREAGHIGTNQLI